MEAIVSKKSFEFSEIQLSVLYNIYKEMIIFQSIWFGISLDYWNYKLMKYIEYS